MGYQEQILLILQGPMVWISLLIFFTGLCVQSIRLRRLTRKTVPAAIAFAANPPKKKKAGGRQKWIRSLAGMKTTALGASPWLSAISIIFHVCLFITPVFLMGHNVLIEAAVGVSIPSFSENISDILTLIVLMCGLFFLLRRLLLKRVRVLSTPYDLFLLVLAVLPFLTGILARHHLLWDYQLMILIHIAAGELLLIMIPFSKFFHMVFFFFGRFFIVNEYSLGAPKRSWQF